MSTFVSMFDTVPFRSYSFPRVVFYIGQCCRCSAGFHCWCRSAWFRGQKSANHHHSDFSIVGSGQMSSRSLIRLIARDVHVENHFRGTFHRMLSANYV